MERTRLEKERIHEEIEAQARQHEEDLAKMMQSLEHSSDQMKTTKEYEKFKRMQSTIKKEQD